MMKKENLKKLGLVAIISCLGLSLGGCSINNLKNDNVNHNHSYVKPEQKKLHTKTEIEPITVDYYDADNTQDADNMMKNHIHNYLNSINNLSDYSVKYEPVDVSLDGNHNGNQAETVYVILQRK